MRADSQARYRGCPLLPYSYRLTHCLTIIRAKISKIWQLPAVHRIVKFNRMYAPQRSYGFGYYPCAVKVVGAKESEDLSTLKDSR